jgi:hypothetical protein
MSRYEYGNNPEKVKNYEAFWQRSPVKRPMVAFSLKGWFPIGEIGSSKNWQLHSCLTPEMVDPAVLAAEQAELLREGELMGDDVFRGDSPTQGIRWLPGMLGVEQRILEGNISEEAEHRSWDELEKIALDKENPWFKKYIRFFDTLREYAKGRYPVGHATMHGPSDLAFMLRGHETSVMDLYDEPEKSLKLLTQLNLFLDEVTKEGFKHVDKFCGGYFDPQYHLWAPGPIKRLQEDATALYSPTLYRDFLKPLDRELAGRYPYNVMHLHSTSMYILEDFLEIKEIKSFEINLDVAADLKAMLPYYKKVQENKRPLIVRGSFSPDDLGLLVDSLESTGLYLVIMVKNSGEMEALRPILGM